MLPVPSAPVVRPSFPDGYDNVGSGYKSKGQDKSTIARVTSYKSKDACDQTNLAHINGSCNINELVDCVPVASEAISIKATVPHNASKAQLLEAIQYLVDAIDEQLDDNLDVVDAGT